MDRKNQFVTVCTRFSCSGCDPVMDTCEILNEVSGLVKGTEFPDYLSDNQLVKKNSAPRRQWL